MSENLNHEILDLVSEYITVQNMSYTAKENRIYVYESSTSSLLRAKWRYYTPTELRRVLHATRGLKCSNDELILSFQETGRIFERTAISDEDTRTGVLNLAMNPPVTKQEVVIDTVLRRLNATHIGGFFFMEVRAVYRDIFKELGMECAHSLYANWATRRFVKFHRFILRERNDRPYFKAKKGENHCPYKFQHTGARLIQRTILQRMDMPHKRIEPKNTRKLKPEVHAQMVESISMEIRHSIEFLPDIKMLKDRNKLTKIEADYLSRLNNVNNVNNKGK